MAETLLRHYTRRDEGTTSSQTSLVCHSRDYPPALAHRLAHRVDHVEDGQVHGDDHATHHDAQDYDHDGLHRGE